MSAKTIFIIIVTVLVTIILMKNTDEVIFWIFGDVRVPKLAVLGVMFALGFVVGAMAFRPRKKPVQEEIDAETGASYPSQQNNSNLSDEDRDYIS